MFQRINSLSLKTEYLVLSQNIPEKDKIQMVFLIRKYGVEHAIKTLRFLKSIGSSNPLGWSSSQIDE